MHDIAFTPEDWDRIRRDHSAWWAGELDRPLVLIEEDTTSPEDDLPWAPRFVAQLPWELSPEEVVERYEIRLANQRWYGDAFPRWWVNFGPGILAGFVGNRVHVAEETVWFETDDDRPLEDIHPQYVDTNPWWQRVQALTRTAAEAWQDTVCVGYTDLGGNLDIAASLRTTKKLLMDCIDAPDEVVRLVNDITRLWLRYFEQLHTLSDIAGCGHTPWAPVWSPRKCYMLQCDFSYMISPAMFEQFVLPDLQACCKYLDHSFYHLDGPGQIPHLDLLLAMPDLHGVQWIPGDGAHPNPADWPDILARIRSAGKLCQLFTSPEGALRIVREHGGKGFMLGVGGRFTEQEAKDFVDTIAKEGRRNT